MAQIDFGELFPFFIGRVRPVHSLFEKLCNAAIRSLKAERPMWNREMEGKAHCEDKTAATSRL